MTRSKRANNTASLAYELYKVVQNIGTLFVRLITSWNIDQFSNFFRCQNQEKICYNIIIKDPITPKGCRYAILYNVTVLKQQFKTSLL